MVCVSPSAISPPLNTSIYWNLLRYSGNMFDFLTAYNSSKLIRRNKAVPAQILEIGLMNSMILALCTDRITFSSQSNFMGSSPFFRFLCGIEASCSAVWCGLLEFFCLVAVNSFNNQSCSFCRWVVVCLTFPALPFVYFDLVFAFRLICSMALLQLIFRSCPVVLCGSSSFSALSVTNRNQRAERRRLIQI